MWVITRWFYMFISKLVLRMHEFHQKEELWHNPNSSPTLQGVGGCNTTPFSWNGQFSGSSDVVVSSWFLYIAPLPFKANIFVQGGGNHEESMVGSKKTEDFPHHRGCFNTIRHGHPWLGWFGWFGVADFGNLRAGLKQLFWRCAVASYWAVKMWREAKMEAK